MTDEDPKAAPEPMSLKDKLRARIRADGPISVATFMAEALYDPRGGYYATKDPIGAGGDFITAPEISQMFGELIGLWCVQTWAELGHPKTLRLIELGPGRGSMMADIVRAGRVRPDFMRALDITLVETSPALQAAQAAQLALAPSAVRWASSLEDAPPGPAIILANEFLDCLPVRQFLRLGEQWRERLVAISPEDPAELAFVASAVPVSAADDAAIPWPLRAAADGAIAEVRPGVAAVLDTLTARFAADPGRALVIDYGPGESEPGDTLQAVRNHEKVAPLAEPGQADLTARVDFGELRRAASVRGLSVAGPVGQGPWLTGLGLEHRAAALLQAKPEAKSALAKQVYRLTDADEMGALFKVMTLSAPGLPAAAGFA